MGTGLPEAKLHVFEEHYSLDSSLLIWICGEGVDGVCLSSQTSQVSEYCLPALSSASL